MSQDTCDNRSAIEYVLFGRSYKTASGKVRLFVDENFADSAEKESSLRYTSILMIANKIVNIKLYMVYVDKVALQL